MVMMLKWFHSSAVSGICEKITIIKLNPTNLLEETISVLRNHGTLKHGDRIIIEENNEQSNV